MFYSLTDTVKSKTVESFQEGMPNGGESFGNKHLNLDLLGEFCL